MQRPVLLSVLLTVLLLAGACTTGNPRRNIIGPAGDSHSEQLLEQGRERAIRERAMHQELTAIKAALDRLDQELLQQERLRTDLQEVDAELGDLADAIAAGAPTERLQDQAGRVRKRLEEVRLRMPDHRVEPLRQRIQAAAASISEEESRQRLWRRRFATAVFITLAGMWVLGLVQLQRRRWPRRAALGITLIASACMLVAILFWPHGPVAALLLLLVLVPPLIGVWESGHNRQRRRFLTAQDELRAAWRDLRACSRLPAGQRAERAGELHDHLQDLRLGSAPCQEIHTAQQALVRVADTLVHNSGTAHRPFDADRPGQATDDDLPARQQAAIAAALAWAGPMLERALHLQPEQVLLHRSAADCTA